MFLLNSHFEGGTISGSHLVHPVWITAPIGGASSDLVSIEDGGLKILSGTADANEVVYLGLTGWSPSSPTTVSAGFDISTNNQPGFEFDVELPSSLTGLSLCLGLWNDLPDDGESLTSNGLYTDDDVTDGFGIILVPGTDEEFGCWELGTSLSNWFATGITAEASGIYRCKAQLDEDRKARFFINGTEVYVSQNPLDADTTLTPILCVRGDAVSVTVKRACVWCQYE